MKIRLGALLVGATLLGACGTPESSEARPASPAEAPSAAPAATPAPFPSPSAATAAPIPAAASDPSAGAPESSALAAEPGAPAVIPASAPAPAPAAPAPPAAGTAPDAAGILARAEKAYDAVRSLQADFVQDLTVPLLDQTQRSRGTMYHRRPDRFLMKFSDPAGDVVVADGKYLWLYYPSTDAKQVIRTTLEEGGHEVDLQREFLSNPTARFRAALDGTESVGGRAADLLTLVPRQSSSPYKKIRLWVDRQDALVRRFEITEQNGTVRRLELRNLKTNVTLPDRLFAFSPPAGAQVFQQ
jgi:outer membrane lipoprotein carrier protein